jgi:hypothetical protein
LAADDLFNHRPSYPTSDRTIFSLSPSQKMGSCLSQTGIPSAPYTIVPCVKSDLKQQFLVENKSNLAMNILDPSNHLKIGSWLNQETAFQAKGKSNSKCVNIDEKNQRLFDLTAETCLTGLSSASQTWVGFVRQ